MKEGALPSCKKRQRLVRAFGKTNPLYGKKPEDRSVEELLEMGMINLDKPSGPTSHQVVSWVREILSAKNVGHGGTLDPRVTGVLPVAINRGTKLLKVLLTAGKEYVGIMRLHREVSEDILRAVFEKFVGEIYQVPPVKSAVKRARRKRRIYYLDIIEIEGRDVLFRVGCEAGTYIRRLCVDIGKKLGVGAHMQELRRTRVGTLSEEESVTLHDLKDAYELWREDGYEEEIRRCIKPIERMLDHLPKIVVRDSAVDALCRGASLTLPGVLEVDSGIKKGDVVAVMTLKGEAVMIGKANMSTEEMLIRDTGVCVIPERVVMERGTYPPMWKKR
ncbi:MAG: RNA-guided pseudouridylation complex pseudouridine synthase subunit Cbf5 [Thermoplasmata archaeon]|nr:MAG: RNA-guided pseudouridylation complex pseudouridine synthase subunit Cbf5 [Thermoplasmata archaeon]